MSSLKKFVRTFAPMVLAICLAISPVAIRAQQSDPAPQAGQNANESTTPAADGGRQLFHQTRVAAGEEAAEQEKDETAQFKQSAPVRWIADHTGLSLSSAYWLCVILNFAVIGIALLQVARKHLPGLFRNRSDSIQRAMQEAQKASEEARRKLSEIESRLMKLDVEIGMMRDSAEKEAAAEEARIKAAAEEDARKIVASAEQEITAVIKSARRDLMAYAADLAVGLAKKQIHVDAATDESLVHDFAGQLTSAPDGPGKDAR